MEKPPAVTTDNESDHGSNNDNNNKAPDSVAGRKTDTPPKPDTPAKPFTRSSNFGRKDARPAIDLPLTTAGKTGKIVSALRKLDTSYNPTVSEPGEEERKEEEDEVASPTVQIHYVYNASLASDPGLPRTYEEAMSGPDKAKWSEAIEKELANFEKRKVWKQIQRATLAPGRKALHTRWIF